MARGAFGCIAGVMLSGAALTEVWAADLRVSPHASVFETVTDNARSTESDRNVDWITTASAGVTTKGTGSHVKLSASYDVSQDIYANNSDLDGYRHRFLGAADTELIDDMLYLDGRGALSQQNVGTLGRLTATDRTTALDQTQVLNYFLAPRFVTRTGGWTVNTLHYRFSEVAFDDADVGSSGARPTPDATSHEFGASIRSGAEFTRLLWQLSADRHISRAEGTTRQTRTTVEAGGEFRVDREIGLLGNVGNDDIGDRRLDRARANDLSDRFWSGGLHWTPGPRTDLRVLAGHRFGGPSWEGTLSYLVAEGVQLHASYETRLETQQSALTNALGFLAVNAEGEVIDTRTGLPGNPNDLQTDLVDDTFRSKTLNLGIVGTRGLNTVSLAGRYLKRAFLNGGGTDETGGLAATLVHRLTPTTDVTIGGSVTAGLGNDTGRSTGNSTTYLEMVSLNHDFTDKVWGLASYIHLDRDGDVNLSENTFMVGAGVVF